MNARAGRPRHMKSRDVNWRWKVSASHASAWIDAALDVARMRIGPQIPVLRVIVRDLFQLLAAEVWLVAGLGGFLDLALVQECAGDARERGLLKQPLARELMHRHAMLLC